MTESSSNWLQNQLTALYTLPDLDAIFDSTFVTATEVEDNSASINLETLKQDIGSRRGAATHVKIEWLEGPTRDGESLMTGSFEIIRTLRFRVRAAPAKNSSVVKFKTKVVHNESNELRIAWYSQEIEEKGMAPIHLGR